MRWFANVKSKKSTQLFEDKDKIFMKFEQVKAEQFPGTASNVWHGFHGVP